AGHHELQLARVYVRQATEAQRHITSEERLRLLESARKFRQPYADEHPENTENGMQLGKVLEALGRTHAGLPNQREEAREWFQKAWKELERVVGEGPEEARLLLMLAENYELLAFQCAGAEALLYMSKARATAEKALQRVENAGSEVYATRYSLGQHLYNLGTTQMENTPPTQR